MLASKARRHVYRSTLGSREKKNKIRTLMETEKVFAVFARGEVCAIACPRIWDLEFRG